MQTRITRMSATVKQGSLDCDISTYRVGDFFHYSVAMMSPVPDDSGKWEAISFIDDYDRHFDSAESALSFGLGRMI